MVKHLIFTKNELRNHFSSLIHQGNDVLKRGSLHFFGVKMRRVIKRLDHSMIRSREIEERNLSGCRFDPQDGVRVVQ